jgi:hypothetical protein
MKDVKFEFNGNEINDLAFFKSLSGMSVEYVFDQVTKQNRNGIVKLVNHLRMLNNFTIYSNERLDSDFNSIITKTEELNEKYYPVYTTKDGDCLYNAISRILFSHEQYNYLIRLGTLFIIFEYGEYFLNLIKRTFGSVNIKGDVVDENIKYKEIIYKVSTFHEWACEYTQVAISILLNKPIYCYTIDINQSRPYSYVYYANEDQLKNTPLIIAFLINHYVPLLARGQKSIIKTKPQSELCRIKLEKIIFYDCKS